MPVPVSVQQQQHSVEIRHTILAHLTATQLDFAYDRNFDITYFNYLEVSHVRCSGQLW